LSLGTPGLHPNPSATSELFQPPPHHPAARLAHGPRRPHRICLWAQRTKWHHRSWPVAQARPRRGLVGPRGGVVQDDVWGHAVPGPKPAGDIPLLRRSCPVSERGCAA
jgi:hypothetical protein